MLPWGLLLSLCMAGTGILLLFSATGGVLNADPAVGCQRAPELSADWTALPKQAQILIGTQTFMRFEERMTWLAALKYCRSHYTDLADLQNVTKEKKESLKCLTNETEAWIGLYINANSGTLTWSSDLGSHVPSWLEKPQFSKGLCAGLRTYSRFGPKLYAVVCTSRQPFICFLDPSIGNRKSAAVPPLLNASSSKVTPSSEVTVGTTPGLSSTAPQPQETASPSPPTSYNPLTAISTPEEGSRTPLVTAQSTSANTTFWTLASTGTAFWSSPSVPQDTVKTSLATMKPTADPTSQGRPYSTGQASDFTGITAHKQVDTDRVTATASATVVATTQVQHLSSSHPVSEEKTPASQPEYSFGILKADFIISTLMDPEEMKGQFLTEIQEVLKFIFGHEQFRLKWVGFEVNKK